MTGRFSRRNGRALMVPLCTTLVAVALILGWGIYSGNSAGWTRVQLDAEEIVALPSQVGFWWFLPLMAIWMVAFYLLPKGKKIDRHEFTEGAWVGVFPTLLVGLVMFMPGTEHGLFEGLKIAVIVSAFVGLIAGLFSEVEGSKIAGAMMGMVFGSSLMLATTETLMADSPEETMGQIVGATIGLLIGFVLGFIVGQLLVRIPQVQRVARKVAQ